MNRLAKPGYNQYSDFCYENKKGSNDDKKTDKRVNSIDGSQSN